MSPSPPSVQSGQEIIDRVRALAPGFRKRAEAAEEARRIPDESAQELLAAGIARILVPPRFGGYGLGLDIWFEVAREISKADASHGWCASLIIHHPHIIGMFPEEAQQAVWADGPDVAIAASVQPRAKVKREHGGYRVSGQDSAFASGVGHSSWVFIGGFVHDAGVPEWKFFLIPPGGYTVRDTWFTAGMRATGSNTIITDNVFVPDTRVISLPQLRDGLARGARSMKARSFRTPFFFYLRSHLRRRCWVQLRAPMTTSGTGPRPAPPRAGQRWPIKQVSRCGWPGPPPTSTRPNCCCAAPPCCRTRRRARPARCWRAACATMRAPPNWRSRAIDTLIALSGTAGFATSNPIQRAWRDIHFASMHVGLNTENNFAHFGRTELGLPPDPTQPYF